MKNSFMNATVKAYKVLSRENSVEKKIRVIALVYCIVRGMYSTVVNPGVVAQNWIADGIAPRMPRIFTRFRFIIRFVLFSFRVYLKNIE